MHHQSAWDTRLSPELRTECLGLSWVLWTSREQPWGPWGCPRFYEQATHQAWASTNKLLWLFPCLCQLVGAGYYYYCIIILLSPQAWDIFWGYFISPSKGLPLVEKTLTPAFTSLFPCGLSFPCICPVFHACALPGAASKAGSSVGMIQFPGQLGWD